MGKRENKLIWVFFVFFYFLKESVLGIQRNQTNKKKVVKQKVKRPIQETH